MFRTSPIKLAGLVAAACVAVAVPAASAAPTGGPDQIVVNGNNTIAYYADGCRVDKLPGHTYLDFKGSPCAGTPVAGGRATVAPSPTGKHYGDACFGGDGHTYEYYGTEAAC